MYEPTNLGTHISAHKPVKQEYSGPIDEKSGISDGMGSVVYNRDDYMQSYEGRFVWNNMHGYGEYHNRWQSLKYKYEGQFYVNKKEGYGRFSYPSGAYFEGLYRNDKRFGPGIYTDAAGYQDVGIWVASKLTRLSRIFEPEGIIPRLASRDEDKIRVLQYRQVVHLEEEKIKDVAEILLESLTHLRNYDKSVLTRAKELYNRLCRDYRAPSFNKPRYNETFFGHESNQLTIDVIMTEEEVQQKIAAEKEEAIEKEDSPSVVIPQIKESKIIHEKYNSDNIRIDDQYSTKTSQQDINVEVIKDQIEEEEPDYRKIEQIDLETMNDTFSLGNHEKQWNIFQNCAIEIPRDFPENSALNSSNEENIEGVSKAETLEEEFDDFGKKKINYTQPTKKVVVTDLMAWNNSPIIIKLLKHVFKHRNFEKTLSFDISKILAGRRGSFRQEGTHEKAALELLEACFSGSPNTISKLISKQNLDIDIADSRGNNGILLAAARDRIGMIDTLLNFGANVDSINDECLTPLSLCVLRLLELIHGVTDWAKAFLPQTMVDNEFTVFKNFEQWHGRISCESLMQQAEQEVIQKLDQRPDMQDNNNSAEKHKKQPQRYIFDMSPIIGVFNSWKKMKSDPTNNRNNKTKVKTTTDTKVRERSLSSKDAKRIRSKELLKDSKRMQDTISSEVSEKKEKIYTTISKLLERGADPNFAQVPYPVLIMAIFTKMPSLVTELLKYGAHPDTTLSKIDHSLTPLLILAASEPADEHALMAKTLLKAKADPSIRADPHYRPDLMDRLRRNRSSEFIDNSEGITALHLLAIRPDMNTDVNGVGSALHYSKLEITCCLNGLNMIIISFEQYLGDLIRVICQHRCIKRSDLYQGHSPLSLAILEGNSTAVETFLRTTCVNVNEQLGADLGNAMLMLESCKLQELLPPDLLQDLIELLLEYGGCPFASARVLEETYNQIEYGRKELMKMSNPPKNKVEVKAKKKESKLQGSQYSKPQDTRNFAKSMNFVEKIAKEKLIARIKANFVRDLMDSPIMRLPPENQSELFEEPIFKNAQTWMSGEDIAIVMKTMNYNRGNVRELVRLFVTACILPHQETLSKMNTLIRNETERIINKVMPLVDGKKHAGVVADFQVDRHVDRKETENFKRIAGCQAELDLQDNRFNVCFECLNVHGKVLILCPECKQVYFCSQECNSICATQGANLHQCPVFYQKEWIRLEKIAMTIGLDPISYILKRFENPEICMDLEKRAMSFVEQRGKKSSKNQEDKTYATIPKCEDKDSTAYGTYGTDKLVDESRNQHAYKDDGAHGTKEQNRNGIIETEYVGNDIKSNKQQKKGRTLDSEDKKANDIKSNRAKTDYLFDNQEDSDRNIASKNTNKKDHRFDIVGDVKNAFNKVISKKRIKKSHKNDDDKDEGAADNGIKLKDGKKNRYARTTNGVEIDGGNKMRTKKKKKEYEIEEDVSNNLEDGKRNRHKRTTKGVEMDGENKTRSKNDKKKDEIKEDVSNNLKLRKGRERSRELSYKRTDESPKFKNTDNRWRDKKGGERSNEFHRSENDKFKKNMQGEHKTKNNKQELKEGINKTRREAELTASNERHKNNRHYVETNVSEKYLDWLLKVSRSAGENLDIDMLLLPYVVFAQGDTYFRILPANEYPKFAGNYSLI